MTPRTWKQEGWKIKLMAGEDQMEGNMRGRFIPAAAQMVWSLGATVLPTTTAGTVAGLHSTA